MTYEFRVWNNQKAMPEVEPKKAAGRLEAIKDAILDQKNKDDPNILIDTKGSGEGAIESIEVTFYNVDIISNDDDFELTSVKRFVKMSIKGNLYLPPDTTLKDAVKSLAGVGKDKGDENKLRDTRLLAKWAAAKPDAPADAKESYYRGIIVWIMTKAGDFRVIRANNMYVQDYCEDYSEGEMGTFSLELQQRIDDSSNFSVKGLKSEPVTAWDIAKSVISKTADVASKAAEVEGELLVAAATAAEAFTGENEATRKLKNAGAATSAAGSLTKSVKSFDKKDIGKSLENISKSGNDLVQKSKTAHDNPAITLAEMEELYIGRIKANPETYAKYKNASASEKRKMLEESAQGTLDRAKVTKRYEESQIDMDKVNDYEKNYADK